MAQPTASEFLAAYLSTVAKRVAETRVYDSMARTEPFERLKGMSAPKKYLAEAALAYLAALADKNLREATLLEQVAKSLLADAPAEISRRLINGHGGVGTGSEREE